MGNTVGNTQQSVRPLSEMSKKPGKESNLISKEDMKSATCIFDATTRINVVGGASTSNEKRIATKKSNTEQRSERKQTCENHAVKNRDDQDSSVNVRTTGETIVEPARPPSRRGFPKTSPRKETSENSPKKNSTKEDRSDKKNTERKNSTSKPSGDSKKKSNLDKRPKSPNEKEEKRTKSKEKATSDGKKSTKKRSTSEGSTHRRRSSSEKKNGKTNNHKGVNNNNDTSGKTEILDSSTGVDSNSNPHSSRNDVPLGIPNGSGSDRSPEGASGDEISLPPQEGFPVMPWHVIPHPRVVQFWNMGPSGLVMESMQKFPIDWFRLPGEDDIPVNADGQFSRPHSTQEWNTVNGFLHDVEHHLEPEEISNPALRRYFAKRRGLKP